MDPGRRAHVCCQVLSALGFAGGGHGERRPAADAPTLGPALLGGRRAVGVAPCDSPQRRRGLFERWDAQARCDGARARDEAKPTRQDRQAQEGHQAHDQGGRRASGPRRWPRHLHKGVERPDRQAPCRVPRQRLDRGASGQALLRRVQDAAQEHPRHAQDSLRVGVAQGEARALRRGHQGRHLHQAVHARVLHRAPGREVREPLRRAAPPPLPHRCVDAQGGRGDQQGRRAAASARTGRPCHHRGLAPRRLHPQD
mmetsp:Transcript_38053/g.113067  ORF Transcript_38053/g.113067 Transcript_38053/m.113067 type:complete len:255 (+) Transcript_38053:219-983(+)